MATFRIKYQIDVVAKSHLQAAEEAEKLMINPVYRPILIVYDGRGHKIVDLEKGTVK